MDAFLKILILVCLLAVSTGFQLSPSLKIKTPVGFQLDISSLKANLQNDNLFTSKRDVKSSSAMSQCFCLPNNSDSQLVTKHLKLDEDQERLVVYFYKAGGTLQVFIPNNQKQDMIPDLNFDRVEGDVLKPVLSKTVFQIFEDSSVTVELNPSVTTDKNVNENDNLNLDSIDHSSNSDLILISGKERNNESETNSPESQETKDEEGDKKNDLTETSNNIDTQSAPVGQIDIDINDKTEQIQKSTPSDQRRNDISFIDTTPMTEIHESTDSEDSFEVLTLKPSEDSKPKGIQTPTHVETNPIFDMIKPIVKENADIEHKKYYDNDRLLQILSILPPDSREYLQSLISQLKSPYSEDVTFDDWLKNQLTRVVIQNLDTPSNINALRNRIIEVFENNGMYLTKNGVLKDSSGNVQKLINIKLRPILIGDPVEYQNMLNYHSSPANPVEISYFQVILITQMNPLSVLGLIPLGKVYLPRKLKRKQKIYYLSDPEFTLLRSAQVPSLGGCKTCKSPILQKNLTPNIKPNFQHLPITGKGQVIYRLVKKPKNAEDSNIPTAQLRTRVNGEKGNMGQSLFGTFGASSDQIRQLLSGVKLPATEPQTVDPNDDLPGIRIIGGNPATSSGPPLVAKGRSAFEIPRIFYNTL